LGQIVNNRIQRANKPEDGVFLPGKASQYPCLGRFAPKELWKCPAMGIHASQDRTVRNNRTTVYSEMLYSVLMRIITRTRLVQFWETYSASKGPLSAWERAVKDAKWNTSADVKQTFRNADWVHSLWVFDVNSNRVIADVKYQSQFSIKENGETKLITKQGIVYINEVFTHTEYDKWTAAKRKKD
jgi:mRNA interferase HigB